MHKVAPQIEAAVDVPLLHIADATAERVQAAGLTRVGLLGTRFTMEEEFYRDRLETRHGLDVLAPPADRARWCIGSSTANCASGHSRTSRDAHSSRWSADLVARGAQGVILGCTEIGLLLRPGRAGAAVRHGHDPRRSRGGIRARHGGR